MKAAFLIDVMTFELREVPRPECPEDGVILSVRACGICGSDLRRWREGPQTTSSSLVPGHEIAGEVVAVGRSVTDLKVGDRLAVAPDIHCGKCYYCKHGLYNLCDHLRLIGITPGYDGGFAEYMVLTQEILRNGVVHRMPPELDFPQAALAEPASSVLAAHAHAGTTLGDTVLVMGAGPIGCLHIIVAKARGARVLVSEPHAGRRQRAEIFDPDGIIDPSRQDVVAWVREMTAGRGADVVICANPIAETQAQAVEAVRKRGRVVFLEAYRKSVPIPCLTPILFTMAKFRSWGRSHITRLFINRRWNLSIRGLSLGKSSLPICFLSRASMKPFTSLPVGMH